jgi:hypothetical protein
MSSLTDFSAAGATGTVALDTGLLDIGPFIPMLQPARWQTPRGKDPMVLALRKESADPDAPRVAMSEEGGGEIAPGQESETESHPGAPASPGPESDSPPPSGGWAGMLVQVFAISLIAAGIALVALKTTGALAPAKTRVVTFDVLKYENAERAQAMKLMGRGGAGAVAPMLSYASKRLRAAIAEAAGPGTLVVLSQAVIQGQTRDITDQVLSELGLPTHVPTSSAIKAASLVPRTMLPPVSAGSGSPLSRLIESGKPAKRKSIVP